MAKPGPRPTPTPLHLLKGASHHRHPKSEPAARPGRTDPPEHLGEAERELWERLAPELEARQLLAPGYALLFEVLVCTAVQWRKARDVLAVTGPVTRGRHDVLVSSPAAREFGRMAALLRAYGAEFGLSPAAVTAIARQQQDAGPPDRADPARFLS